MFQNKKIAVDPNELFFFPITTKRQVDLYSSIMIIFQYINKIATNIITTINYNKLK